MYIALAPSPRNLGDFSVSENGILEIVSNKCGLVARRENVPIVGEDIGVAPRRVT
jgi:hypothetical protein